MRYLSSVEKARIAGKSILLRVDFNAESARDTFRLEASLPTIAFLLTRGAGRTIILTHRGRPREGKVKSGESTKVALPFLRKKLGVAIGFVGGFDLAEVQERVVRSRSKVILLENLRSFRGESENSEKFAEALAKLGDAYVNDAFSVSHRSQASVVALAKVLPAYAGLLLEREVGNLKMAIHPDRKPFVLIVGGAKVPDKIGVIERLSPHAEAILVGGVVANTFLAARGEDIGKSHCDTTSVPEAKRLLKNPKVRLPVDFIREDGRYVDVGPQTVREFAEHIANAKLIVWNGPMGITEDTRFTAGSRGVAQAIAESKAFSILGGGDTNAFVAREKIGKKFDFLSTGGGAMLAFLAGKPMPGLEALGYNSPA
jgi:phosphoglycerate kinase